MMKGVRKWMGYWIIPPVPSSKEPRGQLGVGAHWMNNWPKCHMPWGSLLAYKCLLVCCYFYSFCIYLENITKESENCCSVFLWIVWIFHVTRKWSYFFGNCIVNERHICFIKFFKSSFAKRSIFLLCSY